MNSTELVENQGSATAWLMWKEFRLQQLVLLVGLLLLVIPYVGASFWSSLADNFSLNDTLPYASLWGVILAIITLAVLGGNAFATERADRSAEFQAYLPVSRWALVASKLTIPVLAAVVIWGTHLLALASCDESSNAFAFGSMDTTWIYIHIVIGFAAFCVAWCVSALQDSPTFATGLGMVTPVAIIMTLAFLNWATNGKLEEQFQFETGFWVLSLITGLTCFLIGTGLYLRRVEP